MGSRHAQLGRLGDLDRAGADALPVDADTAPVGVEVSQRDVRRDVKPGNDRLFHRVFGHTGEPGDQRGAGTLALELLPAYRDVPLVDRAQPEERLVERELPVAGDARDAE